jgi:hypothetical protein
MPIDKDEARNSLLLKMYDQMFGDINRHILVVWQAIGVVIGAFALFSLVGKRELSLDLAVAIQILLCGWMLAQLYDSAYWYNRNLVIIANIEREFLDATDLSRIHYYFGAHRKNNKMIMHLRIQRYLGVGIIILILTYHLHERVLPGIHSRMDQFEFLRSLPYFALLFTLLTVNYVRNDRGAALTEFLSNSPGREVEHLGVTQGPGHAVQRTLLKKLWLAIRVYERTAPGG